MSRREILGPGMVSADSRRRCSNFSRIDRRPPPLLQDFRATFVRGGNVPIPHQERVHGMLRPGYPSGNFAQSLPTAVGRRQAAAGL